MSAIVILHMATQCGAVRQLRMRGRLPCGREMYSAPTKPEIISVSGKTRQFQAELHFIPQVDRFWPLDEVERARSSKGLVVARILYWRSCR